MKKIYDLMGHKEFNEDELEVLNLACDALLSAEIPDVKQSVKDYNDNLLSEVMLKLSMKPGKLSAEELRVLYLSSLHYEHYLADIMKVNVAEQSLGSKSSVRHFQINKLRKEFESVLEAAGLI